MFIVVWMVDRSNMLTQGCLGIIWTVWRVHICGKVHRRSKTERGEEVEIRVTEGEEEADEEADEEAEGEEEVEEAVEEEVEEKVVVVLVRLTVLCRVEKRALLCQHSTMPEEEEEKEETRRRRRGGRVKSNSKTCGTTTSGTRPHH